MKPRSHGGHGEDHREMSHPIVLRVFVVSSLWMVAGEVSTGRGFSAEVLTRRSFRFGIGVGKRNSQIVSSELQMAELKTQKNDGDVNAFINSVDAKKQEDCRALITMMSEVTKEEPCMWGTQIIGFGTYQYQYASGRTGEWFQVGFSPRKQNLSLYIMADFPERADLMSRLGKHKTGKSCLYINKLADIDLDVLKELIQRAVAQIKKQGGRC